MKKSYLLLSLMLGAALVGCDQKELATVGSTFTPPVLEVPSDTTLTFTLATADSTVTFNWQPAEYGYDAPVMYTVTMDLAGSAFANSVNLGTTGTTSAAITYEKINNALLTLGGSEGIAKNVEIKVVAKVVGLTPEEISSDSITMTLTPYEVVLVYPHLNLPGSYTPFIGGDWNGSGSEYTRIYSLKSDDAYEGYVNMVRGGDAANNVAFKFTKTSWDDAYGSSVAGILIFKGGSDIPLTTGGYYKVNADITALTYSVLKITRWGVIGSATANGWDSDQAMTYDAATNKWTATLALTVGKIKFRANAGWDLNYGDDGADLKLNAGGADIDVAAAGTYTITLDLVGPVYKYRLVKN